MEPHFESAPESIGPYRLDEVVGRGGMGKVYLAYDQRLARRVAIKRLRPGREDEPDARERLRREARAAAALGHPAIVQVFDILETDSGDWIVMEFVDGPTLADLVRDSPLGVPATLNVARDVAEGLAHAHTQGLVHRDLKTENVMISEIGRAKILDFGLAKRLVGLENEITLTIQGSVLGTCRSMSPEQARGQDLDARSDLFSLGTLLYESLTGESPFLGLSPLDTMNRVCTEPQRDPRELNPDVPEDLGGLIGRLLEKKPEDRPQSARQVADEIATMIRQLESVSDFTDSRTAVMARYEPLAKAPSRASSKESSAATTEALVRTLLMTDLVGSMRLFEQLGDERSAEVSGRHDHVARVLLKEHGGLEIDKTDDGFLLLFKRPVDAVRYALDYHEALEGLSGELEIELSARLGIHLGEVFLRENTPGEVNRGARPLEAEGLAKPTVARLMSLAGGRQTLLTRGAFDLARRAVVGDDSGRELSWLSHGFFSFKGAGEPMEVLEVGMVDFAPLAAPDSGGTAQRLLQAPESDDSTVPILAPARGGRKTLLAAAAVIAAAVLGLALIPAARQFLGNRLLGERSISPPPVAAATFDTAAATTPLRLVVLPFASLGPEEHAYFAAGMTEEISRRLAMLSGLGVVSRTSAAHYVGSGKSLRQIGRELDVAYVLEGTVNWPPAGEGKIRASEGRIRITPSLIRVADDTQVWTTAYERQPDDFLRVQSEIAAEVVGQLDLSLPRSERQALEAQGTDVPAAYFAYLRGLDYRNQPTFSKEGLNQAVLMFERAVEEDPAFTDAYAELSRVHSFLYFNAELTEARRRQARAALERAQTLDGDTPAVRLAAAYYSYYVSRDYERAVEDFSAAGRRLPNNAEILAGLGLAKRRLGRLEEAADLLAQSFSLDRTNPSLARNLGETYRALRDHEEADHWFAVSLDLAPDSPDTLGQRAMNAVPWKDSTQEAWRILDDSPIRDDLRLYSYRLRLDLYAASQARPGEARERYGRILERLESMPERPGGPGAGCWHFWLEALAYRRLGREGEARALVTTCREELRAKPDSAYDLALLGIAEAYLGRRDEALAASRRAIELRANDRYSGPIYLEHQVIALVFLGDGGEAIAHLEHLLSIPYKSSITPAALAMDPVWDPLRDSPRFRRLTSVGSPALE